MQQSEKCPHCGSGLLVKFACSITPTQKKEVPRKVPKARELPAVLIESLGITPGELRSVFPLWDDYHGALRTLKSLGWAMRVEKVRGTQRSARVWRPPV